MAGDKFSLFGKSPQEVRALQIRQGVEQGRALAGQREGRGAVGLAGSLGGILGGMFDIGGQQKQAKIRQDALSAAYDAAKDDPDTYYAKVAEALHKVGDTSGAMAAMEKHRKHKLKTRELNIDEKKVDERSRLKGIALDQKRELFSLEEEGRKMRAEMEDLRKRDISGEKVGVEMKKIEQKAKDLEFKYERLEKQHEVDKDRIDILRMRAGTDKFNADTQRMKLGVDKEIAQLKLSQKENGRLSKAQNKRLEKAFDSYEKFTRSKDLGDVVAKMVADHPEAGGFFSKVDDEQIAKLVQGEMLDKIAKARAEGVQDFDFDRLLLETGDEMLKRWTTEGENMFSIDRPEMNTPLTKDGEDLDARFEKALQGR